MNLNKKANHINSQMRALQHELDYRIITSDDRLKLESLYLQLLEIESEIEELILNDNYKMVDLGVNLRDHGNGYATLTDCYQVDMYNVGGKLVRLNQAKRKLYNSNKGNYKNK